MKNSSSVARRFRNLLSLVHSDTRGGSMVEKVLITIVALGGIIALAAVINHATSEVRDKVDQVISDSNGIAGGGALTSGS